MREIQYKKPRYRKTQEIVGAIAWATNRRGRYPWKSPSVPAQLEQYLQNHGFSITRQQIHTALRAIEEEGFGYRRLHPGGTRTIEFNFHSDVVLDDLPLPNKLAVNGTKEKVQESTSASGEDEPAIASTPSVIIPIPAEPEPEPYRFLELKTLLQNWCKKDAEAYSTWVDTAIRSLKVNT